MIEMQNLTKFYGDVCAVDDISLQINRGEVLGLLGPNGAGKTSTLRMLTGYLPPSSGEIKIKDVSIRDNPIAAKEFMGYLPESAPLYQDMLVYDYLLFVAEIRGLHGDTRQSRIKQLAGICGIAEVMHKPISELSKGYKQRVGLARAMINDPEILVLDEPTSGLDPNHIIEIRYIIKEIGKEKTVILSTHILSEAEATCDRIVIINKGKIVADGASEELTKVAGHKYEIHVSLKDVQFEPAEHALKGLANVEDVKMLEGTNGSTDLALTCSAEHDPRPDIFNAVKDNGWTMLEFYSKSRSLENIFRELTRGSEK